MIKIYFQYHGRADVVSITFDDYFSSQVWYANNALALSFYKLEQL